jgi:predicted LPLAT superfamily acyltransferase
MSRSDWHAVPEVAGALAVRAVVAVLRLLGRRGTSWLLALLALWFALADRRVRRSSRDYLRRVGLRGTLREVIRHVRTFAQVTADRVFLLRGQVERFRILRRGGEPLVELHAAGRGALLVLAHLGSWEILRVHSGQARLPVTVLAYHGNSPAVTGALHALDPAAAAQVLEVRPGDPSFIFELEDRIRRGELVGTMGDRVGLDGKCLELPFLGGMARFPTGPYLMAALLRCPVFFAFGVYEPPDRYHVEYELFAERIALPRGPARDAALREVVARYAARLEERCRAHPYNWFNFYEFWRAA